MWSAVNIPDPTSEPITVSTAKAHAHIDGSDEDALVSLYIAAARSHAEEYCGVRFALRANVVLLCDSFADFARLPEAPVSAVSSITYIDTNGALQTLSSAVYEVRKEGLDCSIVLKSGQSWPSIQDGSRISVTATIGYAAPPSGVIAAMLMLFAHLHKNRAAASETPAMEVPIAITDLLVNHRRYA